MHYGSIRPGLGLAFLFSCGLAGSGTAQEAGVLPPLFGVVAAWDARPSMWAEAFRPAGWAVQPGRAAELYEFGQVPGPRGDAEGMRPPPGIDRI